MATLPTPGSDIGTWGPEMNEFLLVAHNTDGTLKSAGIVVPFSYAGDIVVGAGTGRYLVPAAGSITGVVAVVGTAPTGSPGGRIRIDVNINGVTIFTTQANRPSINVGTTATAAIAVPDVTAVAFGDQVSVDIDQVGATTPGSDLTVQVLFG